MISVWAYQLVSHYLCFDTRYTKAYYIDFRVSEGNVKRFQQFFSPSLIVLGKSLLENVVKEPHLSKIDVSDGFHGICIKSPPQFLVFYA